MPRARRSSLLLVFAATASVSLGLSCGRTEVLRPPPVDAGHDAGVDAGEIDAGVDAGFDAGIDAGFGAGVVDAGRACDIEAHTLRGQGQTPIDILFVVDNSCSMADDQRALAANSASFFDSFSKTQADYHIGVITTDASDRYPGVLGAPFITAATPNVQSVFRDQIMVGDMGSGWERALMTAYDAVREPTLTYNKGFIRPGADFAIVFLGDEDDQSNVSVSRFVTAVNKLKGPDSTVTVAAIVGLKPAGPPNYQCNAEQIAGWRIVDFATEWGDNGLLAVCTDDYATTLKRISGHLVEARCTMNLTTQVDFSQGVHVTVNGVHASWVFHPANGQAPFGSIEISPCPMGGGEVVVSYDDLRCP